MPIVSAANAAFEAVKGHLGIPEHARRGFVEAWENGHRWDYRAGDVVVAHLITDARGRRIVPTPEHVDKVSLAQELNALFLTLA